MTSTGRRIRSTTSWGPVALFAVGYAATLIYSMSVLTPLGSSPIWIADAVLLAALMILEGRFAVVAVLACFAIDTAMGFVRGGKPLTFTAINLISLGETLATWALARRVCGRNPDFADGRRLLAFILGAVLPATAISALLLTLVPLAHNLPPAFAKSWLLNHMVGATVVTPALMVLLQRRRYDAIRRPRAQLAAGLAAFAVPVLAVFLLPIPVPYVAVILPMTFALGFAYGPVGAAWGALIVGFVASLPLTLLVHPTPGDDVFSQILMLQFFTALTLIASLPAAGVVATHARMRALLSRRSQTARAARRRADAAAAARSEFLANMSHEIRTPLNGVLGLTDALARTETAPPRREMLEMILGSGQVLNQLLGDALDLARADSGGLHLAREPFEVRQTVSAAAFLFEALAREKGVDFEVSFDIDQPGVMLGDALRIRQVVSNLISNAVKFTAQGSVEVRCSLKAAGPARYRLEVRVQDTGVGFDETIKARLFNRFEQGDNSVTRRFGGSGLGLAIARKLIQMMGGEIGCDFRPGAGSEFHFCVPLQPAPAAVTGESAEADFNPGRRLTILVAEDHFVNRKVIDAILGGTADLTMAENGQAALEAFQSQSFDLVLMDTHMPVMDGLAAIRAIRALEAGGVRPRTPIISLTADAMPQHIAAALSAGADLHLAKPITGAGLFDAIDQAIRIAADEAAIQAVR